jgi:hypothetical protein
MVLNKGLTQKGEEVTNMGAGSSYSQIFSLIFTYLH